MNAMQPIATQDYGWSQLADRAGLGWPQGTDWAMAQAASAGCGGWEPLLKAPEDASRIGALARAHGLAMRSVFLAGMLHDDEAAPHAIERMAASARAALPFGCTCAAVYPVESAAGEKTDRQLVTQARNLTALARILRDLGVALLYHCEEPDLRHAAREFHHMIAGTDPHLVRVCLDPDAIWRGAGRSMVALLDIARLCGDRVEALHLRQSRNGIWDETVGPGDIDHPALARVLADRRACPLLVLEHAYEDRTPSTLDVVDAHRKSLRYVAAVYSEHPAP